MALIARELRGFECRLPLPIGTASIVAGSWDELPGCGPIRNDRGHGHFAETELANEIHGFAGRARDRAVQLTLGHDELPVIKMVNA
jgi:hypothetical protein